MYAHWGGSELPLVVKHALLRAPDRWDDAAYMYRIIFSDMIEAISKEAERSANG